MEYNPTVWFEIYVEDMKRAKTFYEGLLNVALEEAKMEGVDMWIFPHDISKTGAAGALIKHEMRPSMLMACWSIFWYRIVANSKPGQVLRACQFMYLKWILVSIALSPFLAIVKAIVLAWIPWFYACPERFDQTLLFSEA